MYIKVCAQAHQYPILLAVMNPGSITELLIDNSDYSCAVFPGSGIIVLLINIFLTPFIHVASCWFSGAGVSCASLKPPRVPEQEADGVVQDQHAEV